MDNDFYLVIFVCNKRNSSLVYSLYNESFSVERGSDGYAKNLDLYQPAHFAQADMNLQFLGVCKFISKDRSVSEISWLLEEIDYRCPLLFDSLVWCTAY